MADDYAYYANEFGRHFGLDQSRIEEVEAFARSASVSPDFATMAACHRLLVAQRTRHEHASEVQNQAREREELSAMSPKQRIAYANRETAHRDMRAERKARNGR